MVSDTSRNQIWNGASKNFNLSFAGCGFLGIYHVGVASCIKEYAPHLIRDQVCGASAGALVAAAMITNACLGDATTYTLRIAGKARQRALGPLHPSFNIVKHLREGLETFLPPDAHLVANGRLNVSLTRVSDRQNVVVNQFDSKEELIQVLICSSFIPFYCGILPPKYRGVRYVDGGLSDNIPILNEDTITVSPFAGESDICPTDVSANDMHINLVNTSIQCTVGNLYRASYAFFPPHPEVLADTCKQGFDDTLRFLQKNTLISCTRHLSIKSSVVTEEADPALPVHLSVSDDSSVDDSASDESESDDGNCDDCVRYRREEPPSSLPPAVVIALEAAIDSVNKGLLAPMYNSRAYGVISLMTAPAILPVDVALVLAQRLYEWVPYMPNDMQWFARELSALAKELIRFVKHGRHQYSARFSCQLAITDMDVTPRSVEVHGSASVGSPFIERRTMLKATERLYHHHSHNHNLPARPALPSARSHRAAAGYNGPVRCADDLRHELLEDRIPFKLKRPRFEDCSSHYGYESEAETEEEEDEREEEEEEQEAEEGQMASGTSEVDEAAEASSATYDQFENALEVADQSDSILAFYYTEAANPGVVKVTEIFKLDDPSVDVQLGVVRSRTSSLASRPARKKSDTKRDSLTESVLYKALNMDKNRKLVGSETDLSGTQTKDEQCCASSN